MINESVIRRKFLLIFNGVPSFNVVAEYPFNDMVSKIGKCKPVIKPLSNYQITKKRGKQNG